MTFKIGAITAVLALVGVGAGVAIASQGWSLVSTALVAFSVTSALTALAIALAMLSERPRRASSGARAAGV